MILKIGIITIGSLYWGQDNIRVRWRKNRLNLQEQYSVRLPIRYGRLSKSNTYTMVFSNLCYWKNHGLGLGKIIGCKKGVTIFSDLLEEAQELWIAESKDNERIIAAYWGCVALIRNPRSNKAIVIEEQWKKYISEYKDYPILKHTIKEKPVVTKTGILQIEWPKRIDDYNLDFDLLLCTANDPTLTFSKKPLYPRITDIAKAWKHTQDADYFWNNQQHEIQTYQDNDILKHIR